MEKNTYKLFFHSLFHVAYIMCRVEWRIYLREIRTMPSPNRVTKESDVKEKFFGKQNSRYEKGDHKKKSFCCFGGCIG